MFICQHCQQASQPGEMPARVPTKYRHRVYDVGEGYEVVSEVVVHQGACETAAKTRGETHRQQLQTLRTQQLQQEDSQL